MLRLQRRLAHRSNFATHRTAVSYRSRSRPALSPLRRPNYSQIMTLGRDIVGLTERRITDTRRSISMMFTAANGVLPVLPGAGPLLTAARCHTCRQREGQHDDQT